MSNDWHVHCLDCNVTHRFGDANHCDNLMLALCQHAEAIAALVELQEQSRGDVELRTFYGQIDPAWFRKHLGHRLLPIDEYGVLYGNCIVNVRCECGASHRCVRKYNHEGEHSFREEQRE